MGVHGSLLHTSVPVGLRIEHKLWERYHVNTVDADVSGLRIPDQRCHQLVWALSNHGSSSDAQ